MPVWASEWLECGGKAQQNASAFLSPFKRYTTMNTLEIAPFACDTSKILTTTKGKERGIRYSFTGGQSASELRKSLKATGLKGSALDTKVNEVLRGSATLGEQLAHAFIVSESARGVVWETADSLKRGATLKGILAPAKTAACPDVSEAASALSDADKEALVNQLLEQLAAKQTTVLEA